MKIKFWGVRGSLPVPGKETVRYGGNTASVEVITNNKDKILFDAGTGIYKLGKKLLKEKYTKTIHLFLTHFHWDHIQGLPFFAPFFDKDFHIKIYFYQVNGVGGREVLESQLNPKFFPITCDIFSANVEFIAINELDEVNINGVIIKNTLNHHSAGTVSYKVIENEKSLVFMTDNELYCKKEESHPTVESMYELNKNLVEFVKNADALIHDTQYFEFNFSEKLGWGHSNNAAVAYFAHVSKVKNLYLFHYDPDHSDEKVDELFNQTKEILSTELNSETQVTASYEGLEFIL